MNLTELMRDFKSRIVENQLWDNLMDRNDGVFYRGQRSSGRGGGTGLGALGNGVYLTWSSSMADFFAKEVDGEVKEYRVKPGLKMADSAGADFGEIKQSMGFQPWEYSDDPMFGGMLTMGLKDKGYDGAVSDNQAEGIVIFDPKNVEEVEQ
jgi:hypothetical protein